MCITGKHRIYTHTMPVRRCNCTHQTTKTAALYYTSCHAVTATGLVASWHPITFGCRGLSQAPSSEHEACYQCGRVGATSCGLLKRPCLALAYFLHSRMQSPLRCSSEGACELDLRLRKRQGITLRVHLAPHLTRFLSIVCPTQVHVV